MSDDPREERRAPVEVPVNDKRHGAQSEGDAPADGTPAAEGAPEDELAAARAEAAQYLDDLKRLKAEFENYRKRMVKEQTAMVARASDAVIERLLPILDNFELALLAADRTKDYASMVKGVEMVYGELIELLQKEGLDRIDALGERFDPERHDAVMRADGPGDEIVVVEEMRPGYAIAGRVVRPAMVKVGPPSAPQEADEER